MQRIFQFTSNDDMRPITLTVGAPVQIGEDWQVAVEIDGFPGETCPTLRGGDAIEALIAALQFADFRLRQLARIHGGTITLDGSTELRLTASPLEADVGRD